MKIISSELYVKDNKVYHEGNKPKPKDIGAAPETHTHNYASATTPGGSAEHAIKATEDSLGQRIDKYIKGLSVSGRTITYTRGDGTTGTITTQDNDTDTKVTNTLNTTAKAYITGTTNSATNTGTQVFDTNVYLDTTAGMLTATTFKGALQGNAATATALTTSAGSSTQPIYFSGGKPVAGLSYFARSTQGDIGWGSANNNSPVTVSAIAYWNGAYQGTASNLTYCKHGAFGTIVTKNASDYAPTSHNHGLLHDNFGVIIANTTTDNGWSMINGSYNGFLLKSLRSSANAPAWLQGNYSAGIAFGGADTKGVMSVSYDRPSVRFAGGNGSKPVWHFTVNGSSGKTYNMDSLAANTANTLATTRTINGTSFNGSANITTANWGTARNLQIGNTAKSVNGSANVTWTLSEIGAAAASHNHSNMLTFKSNHGIDWTSASSMSGKTYMGGWHGKLTSGTTGYISLAADGSNTLDLMIDGDIYVRENSKVYHSGNKPTASEIGAAAASHNHTSLGGVTSIDFNAASTDTASIRTTISDASTYLDMYLADDAGQDRFRWRFKPYSSDTSQAVERSLMELYPISANQKSARLLVDGEVVATNDNGLRIISGNYGFFIRNDGSNTYFMFTNSGDQHGNWNSLRPICINNSNGLVTFGNGLSGSLSGNASTATKLETARTIALGGILSGSASFDGSGNVTINATANDITTITKSLKVTTSWMDTGITGSNLATGTYAVQMLVNDGANTNQWYEYYSGIMSWYADNTNSTEADEILLHKAGHASNGRHTYLRTIRIGNSGRLKLQISCTHAFSAASNITFKFKKLI